ncbi:TonB-dependent receptor plug domain-containing protein [Desulfarculus baarsii]
MRKSMITAMLAGAACLALAAGPGLADQAGPGANAETLEPMVVSATLAEQKLSRAPASIQVVDQAQIQMMGADSVSQALSEVTGLVLESESGRVISPSIRGAGPLHTLVLIDSRRMAPGYRGLADLNQIPVTMIERIEIVRGPSSALFGSDALGGVVNIITRKPPKEKTVAGADVKVGTNTHSGGDEVLPQAYAGLGVAPFRFIVGGAYRGQNGWDYDGVAPDDGDDLKQGYVSGQAAVDLGEHHALSLGGYYNDFKRQGLRDIQNALTDRDATDVNSEIFVNYDGTFAERYGVFLQAYQSKYKTDIDLTPRVTDPYYLTNEEYERTQYEGRFSARIADFATATLGGELREDSRGADNVSPEYDSENKAGFGQVDMVFFERLNLVAGLRVDDHSEFGSEWSPRVAASFALTDYARIKASYGHGFRAPIANELYVTTYQRRGKDTYLPNKDLQPETSQTYEIGLQGSLDVSRGLDVELTYFHNDIDDLIEAVLQSSRGSGSSLKNTYKYENIAEAETSGLELLTAINLPCGWRLGAGATYMKTENKQTGEQLADQPEFKGNLNAQWSIKPLGLRARVAFNWFSGAEDGLGGSLDDYTTLDAWLGKDLWANTQVYAGMKNIFDTEVAAYDIQPAFVYLGFRWEL